MPEWANWIDVVGHLSFMTQATANAQCSAHLWRNDTPTDEDFYLHNRIPYLTSSATYTSVFAGTFGMIAPLSIGSGIAYNGATAYVVGNVVWYADRKWYCRLAGTGQTPTDASNYWKPFKEYWTLVALQNTGANQNLLGSGRDLWLRVMFSK